MAKQVNQINCPNCGHAIDVEEAVAHSIRRQIESETAQKYAAQESVGVL